MFDGAAAIASPNGFSRLRFWGEPNFTLKLGKFKGGSGEVDKKNHDTYWTKWPSFLPRGSARDLQPRRRGIKCWVGEGVKR